MDKIPDYIINCIKKLIDKLEENNFAIDKAILFGSYAKGTYDKFSDIDLALVSKSFSGNRFIDKERIRKFVFSVNSDISPLPYHPEDFNEEDYFVRDIIRNGITIV